LTSGLLAQKQARGKFIEEEIIQELRKGICVYSEIK
jgi:hypothetical protein